MILLPDMHPAYRPPTSPNDQGRGAGPLDILVNNAGVNGPTKPTWDYTLAEWNKVLSVDLTDVFPCTRALLQPMRKRGYGRIVNIASIAGKEGGPNACAYAAAESACFFPVMDKVRNVPQSALQIDRERSFRSEL